MKTQRLNIVLVVLLLVVLGYVTAFFYPPEDDSSWFYYLLVALGIVSASLSVLFNRRLFASRLLAFLTESRREWRRVRFAWLMVAIVVGAVLAVWAIGVLVTG